MSHTAFNRRSLLAGATAVSVAGLLSACSNTSSPAGSASPSRVYKLGIAQIVSHPALDSIREGFKAGMKDGSEPPVETPKVADRTTIDVEARDRTRT